MRTNFWRNQSGQALAEACIGLSLLALVYTLAGVFGHMMVNRERTLITARHVAWMRGNGLNIVNAPRSVHQEVERKFFYIPELARIDENVARQRSTSVRRLKPPLMILKGPDVLHVSRVQYGLKPALMAQYPYDQLPYPLLYLKAAFPYINSPATEEMDRLATGALVISVSTVEGQCAWFNVDDSWTKPYWVMLGLVKHVKLIVNAWMDAFG